MRRGGCAAARDRDDPNSANDFQLVFAHDLPQTAPNAIAFHRRTHRARGNESGAKWNVVVSFEHTHQYETTVLGAAVLFHILKFVRAREPPTFWECKPLLRHFAAIVAVTISGGRSKLELSMRTSAAMHAHVQAKVFRPA